MKNTKIPKMEFKKELMMKILRLANLITLLTFLPEESIWPKMRKKTNKPELKKKLFNYKTRLNGAMMKIITILREDKPEEMMEMLFQMLLLCLILRLNCLKNMSVKEQEELIELNL
jgi:hypothetical protein